MAALHTHAYLQMWDCLKIARKYLHVLQKGTSVHAADFSKAHVQTF